MYCLFSIGDILYRHECYADHVVSILSSSLLLKKVVFPIIKYTDSPQYELRQVLAFDLRTCQNVCATIVFFFFFFFFFVIRDLMMPLSDRNQSLKLFDLLLDT